MKQDKNQQRYDRSPYQFRTRSRFLSSVNVRIYRVLFGIIVNHRAKGSATGMAGAYRRKIFVRRFVRKSASFSTRLLWTESMIDSHSMASRFCVRNRRGWKIRPVPRQREISFLLSEKCAKVWFSYGNIGDFAIIVGAAVANKKEKRNIVPRFTIMAVDYI